MHHTLSPFGPAGPGIPGGPIRPFEGKDKHLHDSAFNRRQHPKCHSHEGKVNKWFRVDNDVFSTPSCP